MDQTRPFRAGMIAFAIASMVSVTAICILWLATSAETFRAADHSWNCTVSRGQPSLFGPTYCYPLPIQLSILAFAVSLIGLGGLALNKALATHRDFRESKATPLLRFVIVGVVTGAVMLFETAFVIYATAYQGPLLLWGLAFTAVLVGRIAFPRLKLWLLPLLALPLAAGGLVAGLLLSLLSGVYIGS